MRDYDADLEAQYGADLDGEKDDLFYCADLWCGGHSLPNQRCTTPLQDDEDEEMCP